DMWRNRAQAQMTAEFRRSHDFRPQLLHPCCISLRFNRPNELEIHGEEAQQIVLLRVADMPGALTVLQPEKRYQACIFWVCGFLRRETRRGCCIRGTKVHPR